MYEEKTKLGDVERERTKKRVLTIRDVVDIHPCAKHTLQFLCVFLFSNIIQYLCITYCRREKRRKKTSDVVETMTTHSPASYMYYVRVHDDDEK